MNIFVILNRFYSRNKTIVNLIIVVAIILALVIHAGNKITAERRNSSSVNTATISEVNEVNNLNTENQTSVNQAKTVKSASSVIEVFTDYCNNKNTSKAYALLSEDCKNELYPTENDFKNGYLNNYFSTPRVAKYTLYNGNTYKVDFEEDAIATGKEGVKLTDYITIENSNGYKLSLNGLIRVDEINKTTTGNYLDITVNKKITFLEYEKYQISVLNKLGADFYLDDLFSETSYVEDSSNRKYSLDTQNTAEKDLVAKANSTSVLTPSFLKYYKSSANKTNLICFPKIRAENTTYYDSNVIAESVTTGDSTEINYQEQSTNINGNIAMQVRW